MPSKPITNLNGILPRRHFAGDCWGRWMALSSIVVCILATGCQALHPFTQSARERLASARQSAIGGLEALQKGRLDQAKGFYAQAAQQNPNDHEVQANLARTLRQSGDTEQAIIHMQRAIQLANQNPKTQVELGEMYLEAGRWLPARRQANLALELDRKFGPGWALLGKTESVKGNYDNALSHYQKALGYDPELEDVQLLIVHTYQKTGQPLRSLSAVEQLLSKHHQDEHPEAAVIAKSVALMELEQFAPAIDILQTASQKPNASSEVFVRLGQAQLLLGQVSQARLTLNRGQQKFPQQVLFADLVSQLQTAEQRVAASGTAVVR